MQEMLSDIVYAIDFTKSLSLLFFKNTFVKHVYRSVKEVNCPCLQVLGYQMARN